MRALSAYLLLFAMAVSCSMAYSQVTDRNSIRTPFATELQTEWLQQVMPAAETFSEKTGTPPVYSAYRSNAAGEPELTGFVFFSSDVPPEEKGYSAPIAMLIGLGIDSRLTGIKVLDYRESYRYSRGDFIADLPFQSQFPGKAITDEFRVTRDIDGMSGATLSSFGIGRGTCEAARRVAAAYLGYEEGDAQARSSAANARAQLDLLSWQDLLDQNIVKQITIPMPVGSELQLSIAYMGRQALGEYLIGDEDYTLAERESSARLGSREMILLAVGGTAAAQFRQDRLSLQQGDAPPQRVQQRRFVTAGNADNGVIVGQATYAGAIVLEENFVVTEPFAFHYLASGSIEPAIIEYQLAGLTLALARDEVIASPAQIARAERLQAGLFTRLQYGPPWLNNLDNDTPWSATPWVKVLMLLAIFTLAMAAFFSKQSRLRWAALTATLVYLGFVDGGFLSVSHITSVIAQGPEQILNNLPLLMLVVFTLVTTLLWGRIFCSSLCPFGAVQDLLAHFSPKRWQLKLSQRWHERALNLKYVLLAGILLTALLYSEISVFQYFEPFGTLFFFSASPLLWVILLATLLACVVIPRFYCRYMCPLGAALGAVSLLSPLRIKRVAQCNVCSVCEHVCPTGAIKGAVINFKECVRCDVCESKLIVQAGSCRHSMAKIASTHKDHELIRMIDLSHQS